MVVINRYVKVGMAVAIGAVVGGCVTNTRISDSNRVTTGEFDGRYNFASSSMARKQFAANLNFNCGERTRGTRVVVEDGVIRANHSGETYTTNVDASGNFRLEIPSGYGYNRLGSTSSPGNEITWVYAGQLGNPGKGRFTVGKMSLNNLGCTGSFPITKN